MNDETASAEILRFPDAETLAREAARFVVAAAREAIAERDVFHIALSGGSTPRALFEKLAAEEFRDQIDWSKTQVFFSDERFVPADSPDSNYRMARESLLSHVPINERFVHPVATEDSTPEEASALYEEGIRRVFEVGLAIPRFDLILLGLGPDGHTASLFPDTDALAVQDRLIAPNFVTKMDSWRITFTYPLINAARCIAFLVQGQEKAERVRQVLSGQDDLPASHVRPENGRLVWLLDAAAASDLPAAEAGTRVSMPQEGGA